MKILIVDNRDIHREALTFTLRRLGHQVKTVSLGNSAIRLLRSERFDVTLLGLFLMDMSGLKILEEIRLIDVVPIVMTDYESTLSAKEAILKGATDYLIKPFNPQTLEIVLEKAREHYRSRRERDANQPLPRLEGISESILDNVPFSIFALNSDFILLKFNRKAEEVYHLSSKMLGHHFLTLFPEAAHTKLPLCCKKILKGEKIVIDTVENFSLNHHHPGTYIHEFYPLHAGNRIEGIIVNIREERMIQKQSEQDTYHKLLVPRW